MSVFTKVFASTNIGISKIFPDSSGTKLVVMDEKSDAFVYNPVLGIVDIVL